jgi:drug/metabolite transporter (DMT)-like permease
MIVPYVISFMIAIMYAISAITEKLALEVFTEHYLFIATGLLYGTVAMIYLCFYYKEFGKAIRIPSLWHHSLVVMSILLASVIPMYLWLYVLRRHDKVHIWTAVTYSAPMLTLLFAYLFLDDNITRWNIVGVFLVVIGLMLLAYDEL